MFLHALKTCIGQNLHTRGNKPSHNLHKPETLTIFSAEHQAKPSAKKRKVAVPELALVVVAQEGVPAKRKKAKVAAAAEEEPPPKPAQKRQKKAQPGEPLEAANKGVFTTQPG